MLFLRWNIFFSWVQSSPIRQPAVATDKGIAIALSRHSHSPTFRLLGRCLHGGGAGGGRDCKAFLSFFLFHAGCVSGISIINRPLLPSVRVCVIWVAASSRLWFNDDVHSWATCCQPWKQQRKKNIIEEKVLQTIGKHGSRSCYLSCLLFVSRRRFPLSHPVYVLTT